MIFLTTVKKNLDRDIKTSEINPSYYLHSNNENNNNEYGLDDGEQN